MAEKVQDVMKEEGRTMSDLAHEALRLYMDERESRREHHEMLKDRQTE